MSQTILLRRGALSGLPSLAAGEPAFVTDQFRHYIGSSGGNRLLSVFPKIDATAAPTVNDDAGDGFSVGSLWCDTTNDKSYICLDSTIGSAVWQQSTGGGTGGITELTGDVTAGPGSGSQAATIPNDTVTYAKMQNVSATQRILARHSSGAGDVEEVTLPNVLTWLGNSVGNLVHYSSGGGWSALALGTVGHVLTANASTGATWTATVTSANGQTVGGFTITAANNTFEASGLQLSIPSAGTYLITGTIRGELNLATGANGLVVIKIRNNTDAVDITNSETVIVNAPAAGVNHNSSGSLAILVTVDGAKTFEIYVKRTGGGTWTTSQLSSDANGRTRLQYTKLSV